MPNITLVPRGSIGNNFIPPEYLPAGKDAYYLRNQQTASRQNQWRALQPDEIERLKNNRNSADNWENVLVSKEFDPDLVKDS